MKHIEIKASRVKYAILLVGAVAFVAAGIFKEKSGSGLFC